MGCEVGGVVMVVVTSLFGLLGGSWKADDPMPSSFRVKPLREFVFCLVFAILGL